MEKLECSVLINAEIERVWNYLTDTGCMKLWMGDPDLKLDIQTTWKVGGDFIVRGFHHVSFENRGKILQFDPPFLLEHTHLSSISNLPDRPESYSITKFLLEPKETATLLTVQISNFPTPEIYHHLRFYWLGTPAVIKQVIENA